MNITEEIIKLTPEQYELAVKEILDGAVEG